MVTQQQAPTSQGGSASDRPIRVAMMADVMMNWGGGLDNLRWYANGLAAVAKQKNLRLFILIPKRFTRLRSLVKRALGIKSTQPSMQVVLDALAYIRGEVEIVFYRPTRGSLLRTLRRIRADVVGPSMTPLGADFPYPWLGYMTDYQHKHFPHFFTPRICAERDADFHRMLQEARAVVVNAHEIGNDIERFHPDHRAQVFTLPFAPLPLPAWFQEPAESVREKYQLAEKYFLISNQFFIHKSHLTAFKALAKLDEWADLAGMQIVCTGLMEDARFPQYASELRQQVAELKLTDRIRFLGHIPKQDQIQIMRHAIAVLQPTLYEGGPGGGSVYDAVAVGVPAIVSDIPVNREIENEDVVFFKAESPEDMASKMREVLCRPAPGVPDRERLIQTGEARAVALGEALFRALAGLLLENVPARR